MTNDPTSAQILNLRSRQLYARKNAYLSDEEICDKARFCGVAMIQMIQAGEMRCDQDTIRILHDINRSLEDYGKPRLSLDFLDESNT